MKDVIDAEYHKSLKSLNLQAAAYIFFFAIPFLVQIFFHETEYVLGFLSVCTIEQLILLSYQLYLLKTIGTSDFYKVWANRVTFTHCFTYFVYLPFRVNDTSFVIPDIKFHTNEFLAKSLVMWFIIHTLMILLIALQLANYMETNQTFSKMVVLIYKTMI